MNICTAKPAVSKTDRINNIGTPFANTSAFVVSEEDDGFSLIPRGGVGELCFGGAQVVSWTLRVISCDPTNVHPGTRISRDASAHRPEVHRASQIWTDLPQW